MLNWVIRDFEQNSEHNDYGLNRKYCILWSQIAKCWQKIYWIFEFFFKLVLRLNSEAKSAKNDNLSLINFQIVVINPKSNFSL